MVADRAERTYRNRYRMGVYFADFCLYGVLRPGHTEPEKKTMKPRLLARSVLIMLLMFSLARTQAQEPSALKAFPNTMAGFIKACLDLNGLKTQFIHKLAKDQILDVLHGVHSDLESLRSEKLRLKKRIQQHEIQQSEINGEITNIEVTVRQLESKLVRFGNEIEVVSSPEASRFRSDADDYLNSKMDDLEHLRQFNNPQNQQDTVQALNRIDASLTELEQASKATECIIKLVQDNKRCKDSTFKP
jgi:hypothetical protein